MSPEREQMMRALSREKHAEEYLGDGLYAMFDGWQIWLRAPRENGEHWVAIEPYTYNALTRFAGKCWPSESGTNGGTE